MHNPSTEESTWGVESLHETKKGAETAMELSKSEKFKRWERIYKNNPDALEFGHFEDWCVKEFDVLP